MSDRCLGFTSFIGMGSAWPLKPRWFQISRCTTFALKFIPERAILGCPCNHLTDSLAAAIRSAGMAVTGASGFGRVGDVIATVVTGRLSSG